ncbi:nicotinate-nucleotide--dimethylbenzimidazole phosphoribosyltransferase [Photobacterium atrarenae]|uniref:Nicotinate-nucleotide--dimethylbenzimidazole phosphoribosyltransferase n=1 Tax=Photobacterium atrarenae TaxID=865757 RepID=A0ABY5GDD8_9GAMM|nr:nicotinate-nucleotide--dimethylbenzimidazole phosphoribosyltransferase [Photobacterium atrarenae]UTV26800.1 nicotinate-nucleotide--dimethylbenzimidazole phosphoribosyltransferase [Photobacterium atrarenae]
MFTIAAPETESLSQIQDKINNKTKPLGALGKLEDLAAQLALIQQADHLTISQPHLLVFAGDHGIAQHGVSIAPSEVTTQMVMNFLAGGAAVNCFCRTSDMTIQVIDAGTKLEPADHPQLLKQRLGAGTADFTRQPAMSRDTAFQGLMYGAEAVARVHQQGSNLVGFGEMGIGNTSSAAALMAALLDLPATDCVGRGTGISDEQFEHKLALITRALAVHQAKLEDPLSILACLGGFEIAQIAGGMLKAAELRMTVLVDGFIATAAALIATTMYSAARHYFLFCHCSEESGHQRMLEHLEAKPLLNLGLRLGEGTGAALALPLIRAACEFYNNMASFSEAGVTV